MVSQERDCGQNHSWRAESALNRSRSHERFLNRMQRLPLGNTFYGRHRPVRHRAERAQAGADGLSIEKQGAATTFSAIASAFRPLEAEGVSHKVDE